MIKTNYHTHHKLCRHAEGTTIDYVKHAIKEGFEELGMSDHVYNDHLPDPYRMLDSEVSQYINDVRAIQNKFSGKIKLHLGFECEYVEHDASYYAAFLKEADYLILGHHYIRNEYKSLTSSFGLTRPQEVLQYAKEVVEGMSTGYFSMVAHPDLYMCSYKEFDEACAKAAHMIGQASIDHQVPLEFNANGMRRGMKNTSLGKRYDYPREEFWHIVKTYNPTILLSSDAHAPHLLTDPTMQEAEKVLKSWGLEKEDYLTFKQNPFKFAL